MPVATFDTLKFANALKAAGVPDKQAEAEATVLAEALQLNLKELVTKEDLLATKTDLKREIDDVRREIKDVRGEIKDEIEGVRREIKESEQRVTTRLEVLTSDNKAVRAEIKGEILLLKWMFGAGMTIGIAILGIVLRILVWKTPL